MCLSERSTEKFRCVQAAADGCGTGSVGSGLVQCGWWDGRWADQDDGVSLELGSFARQLRGRRVSLLLPPEVIEVPGQLDTYGFYVRCFDLGTDGPVRITRVCREMRDVRG